VRDLRRLIELYHRWQLRLFPHCTYDEFISKLEKLSNKYVLKVSRSWFSKRVKAHSLMHM